MTELAISSFYLFGASIHAKEADSIDDVMNSCNEEPSTIKEYYNDKRILTEKLEKIKKQSNITSFVYGGVGIFVFLNWFFKTKKNSSTST
jgi:formyltetrahydrofolate synthetase